MIPIRVITEMRDAFNEASHASATRRGGHTAANFGDLIAFLEEDLQDYANNATGMDEHYRRMTEYCLHQRIATLINPGAIPGIALPLFTAAEINVIFRNCLGAWANNMKAPQAHKILFGQMRANSVFQGIIGALTERESELAGRLVTTVTAADLGHGLGCRVTVARHGGKFIALNNRTYAAHIHANVKPLRLEFRDPDQAEINRLAEFENMPGFNAFVFVGARPEWATNPRRLPSDWIPLENPNPPVQVANTFRVPAGWVYA